VTPPVVAEAAMGLGTVRQKALLGQKEEVSRVSRERAELHHPAEEVQEPLGQLETENPLEAKTVLQMVEALALLQEQVSTKFWHSVLPTKKAEHWLRSERRAVPKAE
jgi:hypothetical protein